MKNLELNLDSLTQFKNENMQLQNLIVEIYNLAWEIAEWKMSGYLFNALNSLAVTLKEQDATLIKAGAELGLNEATVKHILKKSAKGLTSEELVSVVAVFNLLKKWRDAQMKGG